MYSVEQRYNEYENGEKLCIEDIHTLFLDTDRLTEYFFNNKEQYSHIREIDSATDSERFYAEHVESIDEATNKIFDFTNLTNENELITLYRGVELGPEDIEPDVNDPGMCWTFDYDTAENFVSQFDMANNPDYAPCILTAQFKAKDIDWLYSVACMIDEPDENEIRVFKNARPVNIEYEVL